jgi:hypothetical protein
MGDPANHEKCGSGLVRFMPASQDRKLPSQLVNRFANVHFSPF